MKTAFEAFVSLFIITLAVLLCATIIAGNVSAVKAKEAYNTYCTQLQDSNFSSFVVNDCLKDADNKGYGLTIIVNTDENGNRSADLVFKYNYVIKIIGVSKEQTIRSHIS